MLSIIIFCLCALLGFVLNPDTVKSSTVDGLIMCGRIIIPSIFPFSVLSLFIHKSNVLCFFEKIAQPFCLKIFGISFRYVSIFFISLFAGYPVGAVLIKNMYKSGEISKKAAEAMLCYCVNSSPSFIIIAVGIGFFRNEAYGWILLAAHIISALLLCILFSRLCITEQTANKPTPYGHTIIDAFIEATYDSSVAVFSICSWVILFCVINSLLSRAAVADIFLCLSEVTSGCKIASESGNLLLASFLLGWGGACVQLQILSSCRILQPRLGLFVGARFLHGIFSSAIVFVVNLFYKPSVMTASSGTKIIARTNSTAIPASVALMLLCLVFLFSIKNSDNQPF